MKKFLSLILCLAMLLSAVSAMAEPVELSFWTVFTGADGDTMQAMVDQFNTEQADIHVTHSPMAQADLYEKLPLAVQTGNDIPDVAVAHISYVPQLADDGVLTDVEYLAENGVDMTNYPEWMVEAVTINGIPYAVPFDLHGCVCFANMDLLAKYGMSSIVDDRAVTFEEVEALTEAIKAAGDADVYATDFYDAKWLYLRLYQEKSEKSWTDADGNLDIDNEIFTQVVEDLRALVEKGCISPKDEDAKTLYLGGKVCLYCGGTWSKNSFVQAGIDFIECIPMGYGAETSLFTTSSHQFIQPANDDRSEETDKAVATFIDWMGAHSDIWADRAGQMAVHSVVTKSEKADSLPQSFMVSEEYGNRAMLFTHYYIALLENAFSHIGLTPLYDSSIDAASVGINLVNEFNDAINQK